MSVLEETTIKHYRLLRRLAHGGMSVVYLADDEQSQSKVAVKLVDDSQPDNLARFRQEGKTMSALHHAHILPAIDHGVYKHWHYLVMPYIEGGTLRKRLSEGLLSGIEAGTILAQVASALQYMHDHGILHCDIKPANILLHEDHVYLADLGLAKTLDEAHEIPLTDALIGTPEYMAPELADEPASVSADIYSLGVLLYQMITGQVPFKGSTPLGTYWKHRQEQPVLPSVHNPAVSQHIEQVILRALEKDPHRRFQTAQALAEAYQEALSATSQPVVVRYISEHVASLHASNAFKRSTIGPMQPSQPMSLRYSAYSRPASALSLPKHVVASVALILLLIIIPISLGFAMYNTTMQAPTSLAMKASVSANLNHSPNTPQTSTSPTPQGVRGIKGANDASDMYNTVPLLPPPYNPPTNKEQKHKHKHKHRHGHEDELAFISMICYNC